MRTSGQGGQRSALQYREACVGGRRKFKAEEDNVHVVNGTKSTRVIISAMGSGYAGAAGRRGVVVVASIRSVAGDLLHG